MQESLRFELSKINSKVCTTIVCPSYIDNSMGKEAEVKCAGVFPLMTEDYVVQRIMAAVIRKQVSILFGLSPFACGKGPLLFRILLLCLLYMACINVVFVVYAGSGHPP